MGTGVATRLEPVVVKFGEVQEGAYNRSLSIVDGTESLIDRLLPVPVKGSSVSDEDDEHQSRLIARVAYLPFRAPVRITMIMFVNTTGAVQTIYVSGRSAAGVVYEKQQQFAQAVLERAKPLTDRVGAMAEGPLAKAREGQEYVTVMVNGMIVRLKLVEARDWTSDKVSRARAGTVAVVVAGVQLACNTTGRVIGRSRAYYLFSSLYLPVEDTPDTPAPATKPVVHASTEGAAPKAAAKAAAGGKLTEAKAGKITEAKAPANGAIAG